MSDFIDDIDQDLLGLFEDHQEIVSLSILSILNSLGPIQLMRNEYWQHTRIDTNDHFERRIHDDSFKRTYRMDFNSFLVLYDMLFPYIGHDIRFSRHGTPHLVELNTPFLVRFSTHFLVGLGTPLFARLGTPLLVIGRVHFGNYVVW